MSRRRTPEKLTRDMLLDAAGRVYFARGEEYFDLGYVQAVRERDGIIRATVHGTQPYKTAVMLGNGAVDGQCSCPLGQEHEFCKHLVNRTNNASYQEAVSFMNKVHGLMKTRGQEVAFADWVRAIKGEYKRKRNFIKYVERRSWGK